MAARRKKKEPAKPAQILTEREFSAGGLIWRPATRGRVPEMVLVQPVGRDTWVLPKGGLEKGETAVQAAMRECREETGLDARIEQQLGDVAYVYSRRKKNGTMVRVFKRVRFYLMRFVGGDPDEHDDEIQAVRWISIIEAQRTASYESERELIIRARTLIGQPAAKSHR